SKFMDRLEQKIKNKEGRPWVTFSLLAPADEYGHDDGISVPEISEKDYVESCISARSPINDKDKKHHDRYVPVFAYLNHDLKGDQSIKRLYDRQDGLPGYFSKVRREFGFWGKIDKICFQRPRVEVHSRMLAPEAQRTIGSSHFEYASKDYV